ncbi:hypothetical protein K3556_08810 [Aliiroseovarius sp. M344]|uniref:hypothetical protein n=1 Tax=Aliiroseovarius sp. M344 TaxID=2867010 RepID=UPI0021AE04F1|nr:hypothetical protein [Aliiroseovarius sp. M344]UWQ13075.1 hypothetical protein K3556_08810 [Aliiroseovarius sp. M344]
MTETRAIRHRNLIATGVYLAASMRVSAQKRGIPRLEDFLFGLVTGAEMIASTLEGPANLADTFMCEQVHLQGILSSRSFHKVRSEIGEHQISEAIGDTETQRNDVAASVFLIVPEVANDIGAELDEILRILVIAIMATATIHFSSFGMETAQEMTLDLLLEERKKHKGTPAHNV